ncbi:response regulator [Chitinimonas lacunae]|uniref:Response regulator n=1 Tax=Chitinimonas lacunae TaxID=1963018 RepID=A0ABV8MUJ9_9NEIS
MAIGGKYTFVVIDDDALLRSLIQGILKDAGYELVAAAPNGEQGLKDCFERRPDFVMLDINLPGTGGLDVLKNLRRMANPPRVIMVSGEATMSHVRSALEHGANGFVVKPFNAARLLAAVEGALRSAPLP